MDVFLPNSCCIPHAISVLFLSTSLSTDQPLHPHRTVLAIMPSTHTSYLFYRNIIIVYPTHQILPALCNLPRFQPFDMYICVIPQQIYTQFIEYSIVMWVEFADPSQSDYPHLVKDPY